ncbi:hypothetical protein [Streptomyces sp. NEAU-H3]|uniref:hypothetical protein n=1 Tax=Streptomyces sp. NEAU-H3 TaxID=2720636 RepID=UPI001439FD9D|nr:hypothetical protein [Streptomyces sp. NEAU-H3]
MLTADNRWVELDADPLAHVAHIEDHEEQLRVSGWSEWGMLSRKDLTPLWLEIYQRPQGQEPEFMVIVCNLGFYRVVYAENTPALMSLQAQWAPAIQAAAVTELLGDLQENGTVSDVASLVQRALSR